MLVDKDKLEKAKEALSNETPDLIAELLNLEQYDSKNHKALCPYHQEDTPSFVWNPKGKYFHCFGCSRKTDIIDAYMETGLTFLEACEQVFDKAGIPYTFGERGVKVQPQYRYPHEEPMNDKEQVIEYLGTRGISQETIDYCDVREDKHGNIVFNYYDTNDVLTLVKYRPSRKVTKGENKTWCQKGSDSSPLLFNMNRVNPKQPLLITEGECFCESTEVFTKDGWVRFGEYTGEDVLQVNPDMTAEFVTPLAMIQKYYDGTMVNVKKTGNINLSTTIEHNWVIRTKDGCLTKTKLKGLPAKFKLGTIPTSVELNGQGLPYSNHELALWVALNADGSLYKRKHKSNRCRFRFRKERKINRLESILNVLNIKYNKTVTCDGVTNLYFDIPDFYTKRLPIEFATKTTIKQKQFIINELLYWDGNSVKDRDYIEFVTSNNHDAEVVQTIAHLCGYDASIYHRRKPNDANDGYYDWLKVTIYTEKQPIILNEKKLSYYTYQGMVYCVTVPSGMILVRDNEHISVCGNCDCLAAIESGYKNSVSIPLGAGNLHWIEQNWDFLEQFNSIILAFDNDDAGYKAQKDVIYRLGTWRTSIMNIPEHVEYKGKKVHVKDINELLFYSGKESVLDAIVNAKDTPVQSVVDFSTIDDIDIDQMPGIYTGFKEVDKVIGKIFFSMVTIVSGLPSSGKSSFLNQIISNVIDNGEKVWIFSKEMNANILSNWLTISLAGAGNLKEYISSYTGEPYYKLPQEIKQKIRDYYDGQLYIYKDDAPNDEDSLFNSMEECVRKFGMRTLIIDNLMCIDLKNASTDKYDAQTAFFNRLLGFAKKYNVAIIIVCHPKKLPAGIKEVDMYDISGSSNIINLAHLSFALRRITPKEKDDPKCKWKDYDVLLSIIKDRIQGRNGAEIPFHYDNPSRRFYTNYEEYSRDFKWDDKHTNQDLPMPDKLRDYAEEIFGDDETDD